MLQGKKAVIFGLANEKSLAYGIARAFRTHGAEIALSWFGEPIRKRVEPIATELGAAFTFGCDVSSDDDIRKAAETVQARWGKADILVHAVAFANRHELQGRYVETSRDGFSLALDISAYSFTAVCKGFESILEENGAALSLTYYGAQKFIPHYNVMGVAKAALEASVMYLANDFGGRGIRVNAISAGPIKTLSSSGVSGFGKSLAHAEQFSPLKRNVSIDEVGNAAAFMVSPLASGITGEVLFVDAGFHTAGFQIPGY